HFMAIEKASVRAAGVVRQILTFSREQNTERKIVDLRTVAQEAMQFLHTTLPAKIEIIYEAETKLPPVLADATQIYQVIMNLGTNAAHAMRKHGGKLIMRLASIEHEAGRLGDTPGLRAGKYA